MCGHLHVIWKNTMRNGIHLLLIVTHSMLINNNFPSENQYEYCYSCACYLCVGITKITCFLCAYKVIKSSQMNLILEWKKEVKNERKLDKEGGRM